VENLIKALQIFLKYGNPDNPTHCEHDVLTVVIDPSLVSEEDLGMLQSLGFSPDDGAFHSYRYGSA
jgi:hypothetical protein